MEMLRNNQIKETLYIDLQLLYFYCFFFLSFLFFPPFFSTSKFIKKKNLRKTKVNHKKETFLAIINISLITYLSLPSSPISCLIFCCSLHHQYKQNKQKQTSIYFGFSFSYLMHVQII